MCSWPARSPSESEYLLCLSYLPPPPPKHTSHFTLHTHFTFPLCRYMGLWMAALAGTIIKLDHSFKMIRLVRDSTGQLQFAAVLTLMNEFCQVRAT